MVPGHLVPALPGPLPSPHLQSIAAWGPQSAVVAPGLVPCPVRPQTAPLQFRQGLVSCSWGAPGEGKPLRLPFKELPRKLGVVKGDSLLFKTFLIRHFLAFWCVFVLWEETFSFTTWAKRKTVLSRLILSYRNLKRLERNLSSRCPEPQGASLCLVCSSELHLTREPWQPSFQPSQGLGATGPSRPAPWALGERPMWARLSCASPGGLCWHLW